MGPPSFGRRCAGLEWLGTGTHPTDMRFDGQAEAEVILARHSWRPAASNMLLDGHNGRPKESRTTYSHPRCGGGEW